MTPLRPTPELRGGKIASFRRRRRPSPGAEPSGRSVFPGSRCPPAITPKPHIGYVLRLSNPSRMLRLISPRATNLLFIRRSAYPADFVVHENNSVSGYRAIK